MLQTLCIRLRSAPTSNPLKRYNVGIRSVDTVDVSGSGARVVFSIHRSVAFHEGWIGLGFGECGEKIKALVSSLCYTFKTIHNFYKLYYIC